MCKQLLITAISVLCLSCTNTKTGESIDNKVYVCNGPQSRCYHFDSLCVAFNRCTGERIDIALDSAVRIYAPCGFCVKRDSDVICEKCDTIIEVKKIERAKNHNNKNPRFAPRNLLEEEIK